MPSRKGIEEDIINGMYKYKSTRKNKNNLHLLGSGSILNETLEAAEILKSEYDIYPDVWSVTSYKSLYDNAMETERKNRLNNKNDKNFIEQNLGSEAGIYVAASDYVKALPRSVSSWFPGSFFALGTDGFGPSDHRDELREHFEVSAQHIVWSALTGLYDRKKIDKKLLNRAKKNLNIDGNKKSPADNYN